MSNRSPGLPYRDSLMAAQRHATLTQNIPQSSLLLAPLLEPWVLAEHSVLGMFQGISQVAKSRKTRNTKNKPGAQAHHIHTMGSREVCNSIGPADVPVFKQNGGEYLPNTGVPNLVQDLLRLAMPVVHYDTSSEAVELSWLCHVPSGRGSLDVNKKLRFVILVVALRGSRLFDTAFDLGHNVIHISETDEEFLFMDLGQMILNALTQGFGFNLSFATPSYSQHLCFKADIRFINLRVRNVIQALSYCQGVGQHLISMRVGR